MASLAPSDSDSHARLILLSRCALTVVTVLDSLEVSAVVVGRWTGTSRIQVRLEDGSYEVAESEVSSADDVEPGDQVVVSLDSQGRPVDWRPAPGIGQRP